MTLDTVNDADGVVTFISTNYCLGDFAIHSICDLANSIHLAFFCRLDERASNLAKTALVIVLKFGELHLEGVSERLLLLSPTVLIPGHFKMTTQLFSLVHSLQKVGALEFYFYWPDDLRSFVLLLRRDRLEKPLPVSHDADLTALKGDQEFRSIVGDVLDAIGIEPLLAVVLEEHGLDPCPDCTLSAVMSPIGRRRAFYRPE